MSVYGHEMQLKLREQHDRPSRNSAGKTEAAARAPAVLGTLTPPVNWQAVRSEFVLPTSLTYMNAGSEGSMPIPTLECYERENRRWASNPSYSFFDDPRLGELQQVNRAETGRFVGADALDLCLTNNTTMGLAMALYGLPWAAGDEVIISDQDTWSLVSPLMILQDRCGIKFIVVPIPVPLKDPESVVAAFRGAITKRTKVIAFSHITWTTGSRFPVQALCSLARENGIATVIDGAHALGTLALNLTALGCDFYACSGHKWLCGPPGTGVLYIRQAPLNPWKILPVLTEQMPVRDQYPISTNLQIRGCNNGPGFAAMLRAAAFQDEIGRDVVERRILELNAYLKRRVIDIWGAAALFSPAPGAPELSSGMATFVPAKEQAAALDQAFINSVVSALLSQNHIYVRTIPFSDFAQYPGKTLYAIRASTHIFNDFSEIDALIENALRIANSTKRAAQ